ncbi:MAG: ribosomal protein S18-alanine N-acetyltransferase [Chloroflexi bacterium]|nr:ribosomal protein S18-alanine N-acetyltransferase [Chloroflexota bacterium]
MEIDDIPEVMEIERQCFTMPWPAHAYRRELKDNRLSRYLVAQWIENEATAAVTQVAEQPKARTKEAPSTKSLVRRALEHLFQGFAQPKPAGGIGTLAGYAGLWLMLDEAHITTIAVRPQLRGQGIGELLLIGLADTAIALGAKYLTLEVRVSNTVAQNLYRKFGFHEEGVRKRYYSDNGEDALIMWSEPLGSQQFQNRLDGLKADLNRKLASARSPGTDGTTSYSASL